LSRPKRELKGLSMTTFDYSHLSPRERLDLIGEIWDSIDADHIPLTSDQAAELDRRYSTLDEDIKQGRDALAIYNDLAARYRCPEQSDTTWPRRRNGMKSKPPERGGAL